MGKDNPRVPITCMGKGMRKNSYTRMDMGKLIGKIFSRGYMGSHNLVGNYTLPSLA